MSSQRKSSGFQLRRLSNFQDGAGGPVQKSPASKAIKIAKTQLSIIFWLSACSSCKNVTRGTTSLLVGGWRGRDPRGHLRDEVVKGLFA
jgi:hypothetical protein